MKKICYVTTIPSTLNAFVLESAKYLHKKNNYSITFISSYNEEFEKKLPKYIKYIPVNMKRGVSFEGMKVIKKLTKIFKEEKFDLVQYSTPNAALYASIAAKRAKIKVRLYCQWGIRYVGFVGIKRRIFKFIEKIICNNSTWIEPDSYGNLKFSYSEKLYNSNKSSVIWNGSASGVDLNRFNVQKKKLFKKEILDKYPALKNKRIIGYVGRLEKDKGINELFEAFKELELRLKNTKLLMIGSNDKPKTIDQELLSWAQNSKNVIFTGSVKDIEKYFAVMDIFILPSYREGFGSVVVEAEAMGIPVIVTNIPGPTDAMLKDKTGLTVEKANVPELKEAIITLLNDSKMREEFSKNAVVFAKENFDNKVLFNYIAEDRERLLAEKKGD